MTIIELLTGLGIFLFGMMQLESSIQILGSDWVKQRLARGTNGALGSVLSGTFLTGLLQSSSLLGLLVLAFASAGMIPLYNAIGLLLGANLGSTFTGWIVATLGFKLDLTAAALPAIGAGGLLQVFAQQRPKPAATGKLVLALGMLLFGLDMMKNAVSDLPGMIEMDMLKQMNSVEFLLLGVGLTAIIQSSAATIMIGLAALNSGFIDLPAAAALAIGADIGTTSTTALGSLQGAPIKRQLALAHFTFNAVVDLLAFFILLPLVPYFRLDDPLYSLVAFHSVFNLLGLFLFVPFLRQFSDWIGRRFVKPVSIADVPAVVPEAALPACEKQVRELLVTVVAVNLQYLTLSLDKLQLSTGQQQRLLEIMAEDSFQPAYHRLKQREGELLRYAAGLEQQPLDAEHAQRLLMLLASLRDGVYAAKTIKDIHANWDELMEGDGALLRDFTLQCQASLKLFYQQLLAVLLVDTGPVELEQVLDELTRNNENRHHDLHKALLAEYRRTDEVPAEQLSTLLNVNREIWYSGQNLILAVQRWYGIAG